MHRSLRQASVGLTLVALLVMPMAAAAAPAPPPPAVIGTVAGNGQTGFTGDGGPATAARLSNAEGVAIGSDGTIVIADTYNNRIRAVDRDGIIRTIAGTGTAGYTGDGGPATEATLFYPFDVAIAPGGTIYVADTYNQVVRLITPDGTIDTLAGTGVGGYSGEGDARAAQLRFPFGVSMAPNGAVLIADTFNQRIREVRSGRISTVAGTGTSGFGGDGGPATAALLAFPYNIAPLRAGGFLIADTSNNRIRSVNREGIITTFAGTGTRTYGGDGGPAAAAQLAGPHGVAVDRSGRVVIADTFNNRIRTVSRDGIITTLAGNGIAGYGGDGGPAAAAQVAIRGGIDVGEPGTVVIADVYNARVRTITWRVSFTFARGELDRLIQANGITEGLATKIGNALAQAELWRTLPKQAPIADTHLDRAIHLLLWQADVIDRGKPNQGDAEALRALAAAISDLYRTP